MKKEELTALGLSEEQAAKVFELNGKDLTKLNNTITTLTTDRDGLKTQLGEANTKLNGYDPEWQTKANEAQRLADEKVKGLEYQYAAAAVVNGKKFTSEAAKKAFLSDLVEKKLPLDNGKFLGFDDFEKSYKEKDPGSFAGEGAPPRIAASTSDLHLFQNTKRAYGPFCVEGNRSFALAFPLVLPARFRRCALDAGA